MITFNCCSLIAAQFGSGFQIEENSNGPNTRISRQSVRRTAGNLCQSRFPRGRRSAGRQDIGNRRRRRDAGKASERTGQLLRRRIDHGWVCRCARTLPSDCDHCELGQPLKGMAGTIRVSRGDEVQRPRLCGHDSRPVSESAPESRHNHGLFILHRSFGERGCIVPQGPVNESSADRRKNVHG